MLQDANADAGGEGWVGSLTYKSTATASPSAADLEALVEQARARNRQLGITGMLLYENGSFLQTIEGPPALVEALWASIKQDPRHEHIELLSEAIVAARLFSDWDLLVHSRLDQSAGAAPKRPTRSSPDAVAAHINTLVRLALNIDDVGINNAIAALVDEGWTSNAIVTLLIEPAARALGDAWLADDCSEFDLTLGLSMLQLAGHAVRYSTTPDTIRKSRYSILLATAPGEPHTLGTTLLADEFTDAGWRVDMVFPDTDEALANQMGAQHPDAIDIELSAALPRHHALANLRATIEHSRLVEPDQPTVISVGGRLFAEAAATAFSVGADHARMTAAGASIRMAELVQQKRKRNAAAAKTGQQG